MAIVLSLTKVMAQKTFLLPFFHAKKKEKDKNIKRKKERENIWNGLTNDKRNINNGNESGNTKNAGNLCIKKYKVMPPRSSNHHLHQQSRTNKFLPYLAFILFSAIFVFKLDVLISQKIFTSERNQERATYTSNESANGTEVARNGTFNQHFIVSWGEEHARVLNDGELLTLSLDKKSGSGFQSRKELMFGKVDMQMKLVPGNSAGTVTTYYFSSHGDYHDEIDFEFLGNSSGNPYTLHTNIFSQGKGEREQQFFLWFDPTADFHTYSILWNPKSVIWFVDNIAIREFKNIENLGVPYPKDQPMRIYSSLWNAEDWATQHGLVKTDWSLAPFTAAYRNYSVDGCVWSRLTRQSSCSDTDFSSKAVLTSELDSRSRERMKKLQKNHMVYDYCKDRWRFPKGPARECKIN